MVRAARAHLGRPLARGDVILTGTPAGVGLRLSPLKRRVAAGSPRSGSARPSSSSRRSRPRRRVLRPGDVIEVDAGPAGRGPHAAHALIPPLGASSIWPGRLAAAWCRATDVAPPGRRGHVRRRSSRIRAMSSSDGEGPGQKPKPPTPSNQSGRRR